MGAFLPIPERWSAKTIASVREFDAWDAEQRRLAGPLAGLRVGLSRGDLSISRHWPHLCCWQWSFSVRWWTFQSRLFSFRIDGPGWTGGYSWTLRLFWCVLISYNRQASDRIAKPGRLDAPRVWFPKAPEATTRSTFSESTERRESNGPTPKNPPTEYV